MKALTRKERKALADKEYMRRFRKEVTSSLRTKKSECFKSTTLQQRKAFLQGIHDGLTIGKAAEQAGLDREQWLAVLPKCYRVVKMEVLIKVEDMK